MHQSYQMICISKQLRSYVKKVAGNLHRDFLITKIDETNVKEFSDKCITIVGLIQDFDIHLIDILLDNSIAFGIICVRNENEFKKYYQKILKTTSLSLREIYLDNFLSETNKLNKNALLKCNAAMLTGHGDYLCFNMSNAILCSQKETESIHYKNMPACIKEKKCFRKKRLGNKDVNLYYAQDLPMEFVFLNTCAGIAFDNRKYSLNCMSLSDAFSCSHCLAYISNYMIGAFSHDETCIFYTMLHYYINFSIALQKFNVLMRQFYMKNPTAIMMGDSKLQLDTSARNLSVLKYKIINTFDESIAIKIRCDHHVKAAVIEIDSNDVLDGFELQDTLMVDLSNMCNYKAAVLNDVKNYKLFLYCNNSFSADKEMLFIKKSCFSDRCSETHLKLKKCLGILDSLILIRETQKSIFEIYYFFFQEISKYIEFQDMLKSNMEFTTYGYNILLKAESMIEQFDSVLLTLLINISKKNDTHLILKNESLILKEGKRLYVGCPVCHSNITIMRFKSINYKQFFYQFVCPKCEIFCVSNLQNTKTKMKVNILRDFINICLYDLDQDFCKPIIGAVIINTEYKIIQYRKVIDKKISLRLNYFQDQLAGAYYLRVMILENGSISILHRRLDF